MKSKSLKALNNYKFYIIVGPLFKVIEVIFELCIPFIVKDIINYGIENNDTFFIITRCILMISLGILGFCSTLICQYLASIASQGYGTKLRDEIFIQSNKLDLSSINRFSKGYIQTLITNDSIYMQNALAVGIRLLIRAPILVIGAMICSFIIDYIVGFIFLGLTFLISIILFFVIRYTSKKYTLIQKNLDFLSNKVSDNLKGNRVIRAFNQEDKEINIFKDETRKYKKKAVNVEIFNSLINPLSFAIINVGIVLILYFTAGNFGFLTLDSGEIIALINYLNQILTALLVVSNLVIIFNKAYASKKRIDEFLNCTNQIVNGNNSCIDIDKHCLELNEVSFSFNGEEKRVLKNVSFKLDLSSSLGIIGGTGSGKSTLLNLINRIYDNSSGEILYFGKSLKSYDINFLKNSISYAGQKPTLYKGSIKSNLLIGKPDASDEEIIQALKDADAYSFVKKYEDGINHEVLENGSNFSGGQKQRLSLARALIKPCKLLVLDDCFSALDFITENKIKNNIYNLQKNRGFALIIVSQRISSIRDMNNIILLDKGRVVDSGNNDELLNKSELYNQINDIQGGNI